MELLMDIVFSLAMIGTIRIIMDAIHIIRQRNKKKEKKDLPYPNTIIINCDNYVHNRVKSLTERTNETNSTAIILKSLAFYETIVSENEMGGRILVEAPDGEMQELRVR